MPIWRDRAGLSPVVRCVRSVADTGRRTYYRCHANRRVWARRLSLPAFGSATGLPLVISRCRDDACLAESGQIVGDAPLAGHASGGVEREEQHLFELESTARRWDGSPSTGLCAGD